MPQAFCYQAELYRLLTSVTTTPTPPAAAAAHTILLHDPPALHLSVIKDGAGLCAEVLIAVDDLQPSWVTHQTTTARAQDWQAIRATLCPALRCTCTHLQPCQPCSKHPTRCWLLPPSCPAALGSQTSSMPAPRTHLLALPAEQGAARTDDLVAAIELVDSLQATADGQARWQMIRLMHPTTSPAHSCLMPGKAAASLLQTFSSCRGSTQSRRSAAQPECFSFLTMPQPGHCLEVFFTTLNDFICKRFRVRDT